MFEWFLQGNWQIHIVSQLHLQSSPNAAPPPITGGSCANHSTTKLRMSSPIDVPSGAEEEAPSLQALADLRKDAHRNTR